MGIVQLLASVGTPASCTTTHQPSLSSPTAEFAGVESKFADVFTDLGNLSESCHIKLRTDAKPHAIYTPRTIPLPLRAAVKTELERMEHLGIVRKVSEPTEWRAPMVVVPKKNGSARICVDHRHLNDSVQRELHQMPTVDEVLGQVCGDQVFLKLDANSGFWQVSLGPDSQLLTTFITSFGRYYFQKLPFGITIFQKRMSEILDGLDGWMVCLIDDMLIFGTTQDEHDRRLHSVLSRLQAAHITLNRDKCVFSVMSIDCLVSASALPASNLMTPRLRLSWPFQPKLVFPAYAAFSGWQIKWGSSPLTWLSLGSLFANCCQHGMHGTGTFRNRRLLKLSKQSCPSPQS